MDTYLLAAFVDIGHKEGDMVTPRWTMPVKITVLQREIVKADQEKYQKLLQEALARLIERDRELVKWHREHACQFAVVDPYDDQVPEVVAHIERIARGELEILTLDLTDFKLVSLN